MVDDRAMQCARVLWEYNFKPNPPWSADALIVMGTNDLSVAYYATRLATHYSFGQIIVTGGVSHALALRGEEFGGTEGEVFARVLTAGGVPSERILIENNARNTGANVLESKRILEDRNVAVRTGQLVHTPTMQLRALATAQKQWSSVEWRISYDKTDFERYIIGLNIEKFIKGLVGDTYRMLWYPRLGFQTEQFMPSHVRQSLRELIEMKMTNPIPGGFSLDVL